MSRKVKQKMYIIRNGTSTSPRSRRSTAASTSSISTLSVCPPTLGARLLRDYGRSQCQYQPRPHHRPHPRSCFLFCLLQYRRPGHACAGELPRIIGLHTFIASKLGWNDTLVLTSPGVDLECQRLCGRPACQAAMKKYQYHLVGEWGSIFCQLVLVLVLIIFWSR